MNTLCHGAGRHSITQNLLLTVWPRMAIARALFGFNRLAEASRDVLDPRLHRGT